MNKTIYIVFLLCVLSFDPASSQDLKTRRLDSLFMALDTNNKAMGSITLSIKGHVIYQRQIGYAVINDSQKVRSSALTEYRVGSITKMFTSVMIFQLIEEGKLNLTTPISKFFPSLPYASKITIGNLLNHHSGIHNFTNDPGYKKWMTQPKSHEALIKNIASFNLDFEPGTKVAYSNSNYVLLGYILEQVTHESYTKNLQKRIAAKAGLNHTYVGSKISPANQEAYSYRYEGTWKKQSQTDMSIPGGAGCVVSTSSDLALFVESLFSGKLMNDTSLKRMTTLIDGYGMGIFQYPFGNRKAFGHTGGIDAFSSMLSYFPEDSMAVAFTTNGQVYPLNDILIGVLSICYNYPYSIPTFETLKLSDEELEQYVGIYSSTKLPLKITITHEKNILYAQATGQSAFPLDATEKNRFRFDLAGIIMEFSPATGEMVLKQGGGMYLFTRQH